jgi:diguanylate cyclase (GGDEF)-like protein
MFKLRRKYKTEFAKISCVALTLIIAYFFVFSRIHLFAVAKLKAQDAAGQISSLLKPLPKHSQDIVIIMVDDESFRVLDKKWPWRRAMFAYLIDKLKPYQPKVMAVDFSFVGESEQKIDDELLIQAMSYSNNVILASYISPKGEYIAPWKKIADSAWAFGFINKPRDRDFFIRSARAAMFSQKGEIIDYSFEVKILAKYLGTNPKEIAYDGKNINIKNFSIPLTKNGTLPINFRLKFNQFKCIPFWQVLNSNLHPDTFKDKIVLVGSTNEIVHDIYYTPLGIMPGVVINANELLMLLNKDFIKDAPYWLEFLVMCIFVFLVTIITYRAKKPLLILLSAVGLILLFWGVCILLLTRNIRIDCFGPAFMMALCYVGISVFKYFKLVLENINLRTLAITDELTGLFTYRYFEVYLNNELERSKRYNLPLSLVIMDIDHFKKVNDTYGHETGNTVLRAIAEVFRKNSRKADLLFRYGGEEFCIILTHTLKGGGFSYAEKMRHKIEELRFTGEKNLRVTSSFGIASFPEVNAQTIKDLINAADTALYKAKGSGRNCSVTFDQSLSIKDSR